MNATYPQNCLMSQLIVCDVCGKSLADHAGADHDFIPRWIYDPSSWKRGARFAHSELDPPSDVYVTVEDRLRVNLTCTAPAPTVNLALRIQRPDGQVIPMLQVLTPAATRAVQTFDFDMCEGFLLDVVVSTATPAVRRGGLYVDADMIRGAGANAYTIRNIIDSYVTTQSDAGWPEGGTYESTAPMGLLRVVQQANPGAGAEFALTVPAGARWEILSLNAQLATAVAAGNRQPVFQITDGAAHVMHNTQFSGNQAASLTYQYSAAEGDGVAVNAPFNQGALPHNCFLLQGWTLQSLTTNIQAADQWSNIWVMLQEWSEL